MRRQRLRLERAGGALDRNTVDSPTGCDDRLRLNSYWYPNRVSPPACCAPRHLPAGSMGCSMRATSRAGWEIPPSRAR